MGAGAVGLASRVVAPRSANRTKSHLKPSVSLQEPKLAVAFLFRQEVCRSYAEVVRVIKKKQPGQVEDMKAFWTRLDSPGMGSKGGGRNKRGGGGEIQKYPKNMQETR